MMRLFRCRGCSLRRRKPSIITQVVAVLVLITASWALILVLQSTHSRQSSEATLHAAGIDYEMYRTHTERDSVRVPVNARNSSVHEPSEGGPKAANARLLKGVRTYVLNLPKQEANTSDTKDKVEHSNNVSRPASVTQGTTDSQKEPSQKEPSQQRAKVAAQVTVDSLPSQIGPDSLNLLQTLLHRLNAEQRIQNSDKFPPFSESSLVLVVQAHRRDGYLRQLFNSLRNVRGIEDILLVISHDYYYDDMMKLVQSVDFCRVVQIFYPFSLQAYPDSFPGTSKDDCPRDSTKENAHAMNCSNADHPDTYGHYREAKITAVKHHWWWKANVVFDRMRETRGFNGYVFFLEEDHYLAPDFIHVAKMMIKLKEEQSTDCDFINLGMYNVIKTYGTLSSRVSVGIWTAGKNNMGFGMDRKAWNTMKSCSKHFCSYDDYNWDWSINSMGSACLKRNLKVMVVKAPRIFHIGNCGVHHHTKLCNEEGDAQKVISRLEPQKDHLFPSDLYLDGGLYPPAPRKKMKPFGGWGDIRDHNMCLSFVNNALNVTL